MRAFAASLALFTVLVFCSVLNCLYVGRVTKEMTSLEKSFPVKEGDGALPLSSSLAEALAVWDKAEPRLYCFMKSTYVYSVRMALLGVRDYYTEGSASDYEAARSQLREALKNLGEADSLSLRSII